ncbi:hypothetical protein KSD_14150 [Ktedonobacter sp. SOSP1-85]|uniref:hypothetical protein n=1 Tax=Ktedonobacter sp. SOSP1-85 TaxID=2778367 RepID=UPI001916B314|nr:hypothetical protein [Ktedonobacter sp. SOSP1-85]GHO73644.1 hypothetical protein KSD_14150 [Ktedonobacter sp. SOSP1-85]
MRRSQFSLLLILSGLILAIGGLIYGTRSHDLGYQSSEQGTLQHAIYQSDPTTPNSSSSGTEYLQLSNDPKIYIVNVADIANANKLNALSAHNYTFRYDSDTAQPINVTGKDTATYSSNYTLIGTGYKVVEIIGYDSSNQPVNILTNTFLQKPRGRYENDWFLGSGLAMLGIILLLTSLFTRRGTQTPDAPLRIVVQSGQIQPTPGQTPHPGPYSQYQSQTTYPVASNQFAQPGAPTSMSTYTSYPSGQQPPQ